MGDFPVSAIAGLSCARMKGTAPRALLIAAPGWRLAGRLRECLGGLEVQRFGESEVACAKLREASWDVAIVDFPDQPAKQVIASLHDAMPSLPVIALSDSEDTVAARGLLRAGADDCVIPAEVTRKSFVRIVRVAVERSRRSARVLALAHTDPLTGLANRGCFVARLQRDILRAQPGSALALLYLDVDRFKWVNDELGHNVGDQLLQTLAMKLDGLTRTGDLVARLGGDEFIFLAQGRTPADLFSLVTNVVALARETTPVGEVSVSSTLSVGVARYPRDGKSVTELLASADQAMYRAKVEGRNQFRFAGREMAAVSAPVVTNTVEWGDDAERQIVAQPRIHTLTGGATAACLGWRVQHAVISPPDLVVMSPAGEARDRMLCWVMTQAVALREQASSCTRVSVELNAEMLETESFENAVLSATSELKARGAELELSIPARVLGAHEGGPTTSLRRLGKYGARLVLSSLGSTAISVSRIRELPLSAIVLDSSVHAGLAENLDVQASVRAWVALGHHLSLEVVATEISRRDQLRWLLRNLGTEVQGDAVMEAMTPADYDRWMQNSQRLVLSDLADVLEGKPRVLM